MAKNRDKKLIDQNKLWDFQRQLTKLSKKEFGTMEESDDELVQVSLLDRTRFQCSHYSPIPYSHDVETVEDHDNLVRALQINLGTATDDVKRYLSKVQSELADQRDQAARVAAARKSKLRLCWVPNCSTCGGLRYDDPIKDLMGFIHYGFKEPTVEPKKLDRFRGVFRFMLPGIGGGYLVTWVHEPLKLKDDPPDKLPFGELSFAGKEVSDFRYDKTKPEGERLALRRPDAVPPYLIPLLKAEISRPIPKRAD